MSQIQLLKCVKCGKVNTPKITDLGDFVIPEKCRNPGCRNILDRQRVESGIQKRMQYLQPHPNYNFGLINKKQKEKKQKKIYYFCRKCELFFDDNISLGRHNQRRHSNGL